MTPSRRSSWLALLAALALIPNVPARFTDEVTSVRDASVVPPPPNPASPTGAPPELGRSARDWPLSNYDYAHTRATFASSIDSTNVATLEKKWSFDRIATGIWGAATAAPVVIDRVVYYQDMRSNVFALDLGTGAVIWTAPSSSDPGWGPNGVAVGYGKVFAIDGPTAFRALDIDSGEEIWRIGKSELHLRSVESVGIPPLVYDHVV